MDFILRIMDTTRPLNIIPVHPLLEAVLLSLISVVLLITIMLCWENLVYWLRTKRQTSKSTSHVQVPARRSASREEKKTPVPQPGNKPEKAPPKPMPRKPVVQVYPASLRVNSTRKTTGNKVTVVKANPLPYYRERGWTKKGKLIKGYYRTKLGSFMGAIELRPGGEHKFFIYHPPEAVLSGPHSACFNKAGKTENGYKYSIHFRVHAKDIDSGIMAVERTIYESLKRGGFS